MFCNTEILKHNTEKPLYSAVTTCYITTILQCNH